MKYSELSVKERFVLCPTTALRNELVSISAPSPTETRPECGLAYGESNTPFAQAMFLACRPAFNPSHVSDADTFSHLLNMRDTYAAQQLAWSKHISGRKAGTFEVDRKPNGGRRVGINAYLGQEHYPDAWYERRARDIVEQPEVNVYAPEADHTAGVLNAESYLISATAYEKRVVEASAPDKKVDDRLVAKYREDFGMSFSEWRDIVKTYGSREAITLLPRESIKHLTGLSDEELDSIYGVDAAPKTAISHLINRK